MRSFTSLARAGGKLIMCCAAVPDNRTLATLRKPVVTFSSASHTSTCLGTVMLPLLIVLVSMVTVEIRDVFSPWKEKTNSTGRCFVGHFQPQRTQRWNFFGAVTTYGTPSIRFDGRQSSSAVGRLSSPSRTTCSTRPPKTASAMLYPGGGSVLGCTCATSTSVVT